MTKLLTLNTMIEKGDLDERLLDIYVSEKRVRREKDRLIKALRRFNEIFGSDAPVEIYSAPGRSEICGNHTDHQHGQVLAASISDDAIAVVSKTDDNTVSVLSEGYDMITISLDDLSRESFKEGTTNALIAGVLARTRDLDHSIGGFNAYITSDVLSGSGLSSSAAFETIIGTILSGLYNDMKISPIEIAMIGQFAENVFFGKPCGLMDQMACSVGSLCHIDFADPQNPVVEKIEFDLEKAGYNLCITDTKGSHADLTDDYAAVPFEMSSVAALFGKDVLNELSENEIIFGADRIRKECGDRAFLRAVHFYEENRRVEKETAALKNGDMASFLENIRLSGDSSFKYLQNVYTNHDITHQNVSVALMISQLVLGNNGVARVHGGGFAGTIQAFVKKEAVPSYRAAMDRLLGEGSCNVLMIRKYGGIRIL